MDDGDDGGREDAKVLAGLSTVLVATIQEVKDRISHIEFLFCSQLFPRIQSRRRSIPRRTAPEKEWAEREASLLRQVDEFRLGKQQAEEEARRLADFLEGERAETTRRIEAEKALWLEQLGEVEKAKDATITELKEKLRVAEDDHARRKELVGSLLEEIEKNSMELKAEHLKRKQLAYSWAKLEERYKHLKSQYCFLLGKTGLSPEPRDVVEGDRVFSPSSLPGKRKSPQDRYHTDEGVLSKRDDLGDGSVVRERESRSSKISGSKPVVISTGEKVFCGLKASLPSWVDTRARNEADGLDPHDDFLNTPMENLRENLTKTPTDAALPPLGVLEPSLNGADLDQPHCETKEVDAGPSVQKHQISVSKPEKKGFKYVEPVRKKSERENLRGVECKQCKKFYDAVLPDGRGKDDGATGVVRCEHHEGVSRHRYRYAPPMTPEGFWNIGFDSDM